MASEKRVRKRETLKGRGDLKQQGRQRSKGTEGVSESDKQTHRHTDIQTHTLREKDMIVVCVHKMQCEFVSSLYVCRQTSL